MKKFYFILVGLFVAVAWFGLSFQTAAQSEINQAGENNRVSPNIVISQFQTAGTSATDEFIELHNNSSSSVNLQGFRLVYRSANGTTDVPFIEWTSSTIISPGGYYLIASTFYDDPVAPDITFNPTTCSCSVSAAGGGYSLLMLASSPMFAASFLITKALTRRDAPEVIVAWQSLTVSLFTLPAALWAWEWPSAAQWGLVAVCGALGTFGHFMLTTAFKLADISTAQPVKFLDLIWAAALGYLFFAEVPEKATLIGAAVIFVATSWIAQVEARRRA